MTTAPDGSLAYHKILVCFTVDLLFKVNNLYDFSRRNFAAFEGLPYMNILSISW
jgi:hypothetical protein